MVYLFLADGFEEVEAITPYDYLKRSGFDVKLIGVGKKEIIGSHNLQVLTDFEIDSIEINIKKEDLIILPGGLNGTKNLYNNEKVLKIVEEAFEKASIAAICAAPSIFGRLGLLKGKKACCYDGFEGYLEGATVLNEDVVVDSNIITSKGAGTAQQFAFEIVKYIAGEEKCKEIKKQVLWKF